MDAHHSEYGPLNQLDEDSHDTRDLESSISSSPPASAASPTTYTSLLEHSLTPLSMHGSDFHISRFGSPISHGDKLARKQSADLDKNAEATPEADAPKLATPHRNHDSCTCTATVDDMAGSSDSTRATAPARERSCRQHDFPFSHQARDAVSQLQPQRKPSSPSSSASGIQGNKEDRLSPKQSQQSAKQHEQRPTSGSRQISRQCSNTSEPCNDSDPPAIVRPTFTNRRPLPAQSLPAIDTATDASSTQPAPRSHFSSPDSSAEPPGQPLVRTRSCSANVALQHPVPDLNVRSGAYVGNIAALEATAERFSMTSSIEDAIREAHQELKRSDSRRSSILAASLKSPDGVSDPPSFAKQSSIVDINSTARSGGYSPGGFIMSPAHSLRGGSRLRSASKTSATGSATGSVGESLAIVDDGFPFLSRSGPGKASVRSVQSNKVSLPEIAEVEAPLSLTQAALDEADRLGAVGEEHEDDDTIRASAHQRNDTEYDAGIDIDFDRTPDANPRPADHSGYGGDASGYQEYQPFAPSQQHHDDGMRPKSSGSGGTYDKTHDAFGDFDGVHCDPDTVETIQFPELEHVEMPPPRPRAERPRPTGRPQSYFDPETGNQMMYYPARVPAMLNLPQKLSKNPQAAERKRRTQLMSHLIQLEQRESRVWLPDPVEELNESPLLDDDQHRHLMSPEPAAALDAGDQRLSLLDPLATSPDPAEETMTPAIPQQEYRRPPRLTDRDKRKSHMSTLGNFPPQLRASAFFDLPNTTPKIEVKDGSAMKTLDSILDASAKAPVSAFTDHAFAGALGSEVYGAERKKKKKPVTAETSPDPQASSGTMLESKKRGSFFPLLGHKRKDSEPLDAAADRRSLMGANQRPDDDPLSPGLSEGAGAALAPDADEAESSEDDEENMYAGAPTTLLAELQLRKQQQKMRTRPINKAFPDGMHTTLLEMDAVAEVERKQRKGKQVNLAWEDPSLKPVQDDSDDEDVPLGVILAARAAGNSDIALVSAELNRPLGLMEKKDMEDNEPLSRRRDRLQGRDTRPNMFLGAGLGPNAANKRQSVLTLTPTIAALQGANAINAGQQAPVAEGEESDDDEVEGETLAERRKRIQEKEAAELPRARPVSGAFSLELLSHFGDPEEEAKEREREKEAAAKAAAEREKENAPPAGEEEETLGQRRRRLQAEKEAREREMGSAIPRQHSLANVLGAHPFDSARGGVDPRVAAQMQTNEAEMWKAREKEQRMAMLRAQMPQNLAPLNGGVTQAGGFLGGRFNDGTGGGYGLSGMRNDGPGYGHWASQSRQSVAMSGYGQQMGQQGMGMQGAYNPYAQSMGGGAMTPQQMAQMQQMQMMQMQMPSHMQNPGAHVDMVERWRQSVHP